MPTYITFFNIDFNHWEYRTNMILRPSRAGWNHWFKNGDWCDRDGWSLYPQAGRTTLEPRAPGLQIPCPQLSGEHSKYCIIPFHKNGFGCCRRLKVWWLSYPPDGANRLYAFWEQERVRRGKGIHSLTPIEQLRDLLIRFIETKQASLLSIPIQPSLGRIPVQSKYLAI